MFGKSFPVQQSPAEITDRSLPFSDVFLRENFPHGVADGVPPAYEFRHPGRIHETGTGSDGDSAFTVEYGAVLEIVKTIFRFENPGFYSDGQIVVAQCRFGTVYCTPAGLLPERLFGNAAGNVDAGDFDLSEQMFHNGTDGLHLNVVGGTHHDIGNGTGSGPPVFSLENTMRADLASVESQYQGDHGDNERFDSPRFPHFVEAVSVGFGFWRNYQGIHIVHDFRRAVNIVDFEDAVRYAVGIEGFFQGFLSEMEGKIIRTGCGRHFVAGDSDEHLGSQFEGAVEKRAVAFVDYVERSCDCRFHVRSLRDPLSGWPRWLLPKGLRR